jgi:hypothetical protein
MMKGEREGVCDDGEVETRLEVSSPWFECG